MARARTITRRVYVTRRGRSRRKGMTLSLAVAAGFAPAVAHAVQGYQAKGLDGAAHNTVVGFTGYDYWAHKLDMGALRYGLIPAVGGVLVHKIAGKLGINRALASAGIPFIRI